MLEELVAEFKFFRKISKNTIIKPHDLMEKVMLDLLGNLHVDGFHLGEGTTPKLGMQYILTLLGRPKDKPGDSYGLAWLTNTLEDLQHPPGFSAVSRWHK